MNWTSVFRNLRIFVLGLFVLSYLIQRFHFIEFEGFLTEDKLRTINIFAVLTYGILYILELKFLVKEKENVITELQSKLDTYEK